MPTKDEIETAYNQLVITIRDGETFPADHDFYADHAANMQAARDLKNLDVSAMQRGEIERLKVELANRDAAYAAEQRMQAAGIDPADIEAVKNIK